jgi:hypothetical protein
MWLIKYRNDDGYICDVFIKAKSIGEAISLYEENYRYEIMSIDHRTNTEVIC